MLLSVKDLKVSFRTNDGDVHAVNGITFDIDRGETMAIVGESGSGKSQLVFAILGLLAKNGWATGDVLFDGTHILGLPEADMNRIRANQIAMIFQDPMTSLNPYMRISEQMEEVLILHKGISKTDARTEAVRMLDAVGIPEARGRVQMHPHEFSGGMRQRVMIAMALLCRPRLLIADEPTTALDVTVQAQIMDLLAEIQAEFDTAMILITHDLGIVAGSCDKTMVLYGGQIMEQGATDALFAHPGHPYTHGLLEAVPRLDRADAELRTIAGEPPDMSNLPEGCPFSPRCVQVMPQCAQTRPKLEGFGTGRARACHLPVREVA
ncbi:MAG: oligopeptide/dipeptide ABC transporter ATP-binding protein [Pseudomonadota bacterium]